MAKRWFPVTAFAAAVLFTFVMTAGVMAQETPAKETPAQETPAQKPQEASVRVMLKTTMGNIVLELDQAKAPITVKNFLNYVDKGFFNGTIFHRVIPDFMIQGGGFTPEMAQKQTDAAIQNEWKNGLKNLRGTISMARLGGQANSATSQFFINVKDNTGLDQPRDGAGYAVFGKVVEGMDVVDKIQHVPTGSQGMHQNVPTTPIIVEKAVKVNAKGEEMPLTPAKPAEDKPEKTE